MKLVLPGINIKLIVNKKIKVSRGLLGAKQKCYEGILASAPPWCIKRYLEIQSYVKMRGA